MKNFHFRYTFLFFSYLSSAQKLCNVKRDCGGITWSKGRYELRAGRHFKITPRGYWRPERAYLKKC